MMSSEISCDMQDTQCKKYVIFLSSMMVNQSVDATKLHNNSSHAGMTTVLTSNVCSSFNTGASDKIYILGIGPVLKHYDNDIYRTPNTSNDVVRCIRF